VVGLGRECRVDVYEKGSEIIVEAELPGLGPEDVRVTVETHLLTVHARVPKRPGDRRYHRRERASERILREIPLPIAVRRDQATATVRNGVLEVRLRARLESVGVSPWPVKVRRGVRAAS